MTTNTLLPIVPGTLNGHTTSLVDARQLHTFHGVGRYFSTWIADRIQECHFAEGEDFSPVLGKSRGDRPSIDYFLTLDMAKELAMVERTAMGREARRYFIDCERQLRQLRQGLAKVRPAVPVDMTRAERQAVNRQAWAEVSGEVYAAFHARRETLLQRYAEAKSTGPVILPRGLRIPHQTGHRFQSNLDSHL